MTIILDNHTLLDHFKSQLLLVIVGFFVTHIISAQTSQDPATQPFCTSSITIPPRPIITESLQQDDTYITADQIDSIEGGVSRLIDNAEIARNQQQAVANRIDYDQVSENADLFGNVSYWDNEAYLNSPTARIQFKDSTGLFTDADYWVYSNRLHGHAQELFVDPGMVTRGNNIDFTTCASGDTFWNLATDIWKLTADSLNLDHETERGSARNVVLRVKDIPVFYTPYLTFPLSGKRKSGLLAPSYGASERNGFEFRAPYYWNIAPHMDATITPRIITDSGVILMGEYRYLFKKSSGHINFDYLPSDPLFNNRDRSLVSLAHQQSFLKTGSISLLFNRASDNRYFEDFSSSLSKTSTQFLDRHAIASYSWNINDHYLGMNTTVQDFQVTDRNLSVLSEPYIKLPSTTLWFNSPRRNNYINYSINSEVVYFTSGDDALLNKVNGFRTDIYPSISFPYYQTAGYVTPKLGIRYTQYNLDENNVFDNSPDRFIPIVSVNSGIFMERNITLFGDNILQTLEPRVFYLYVPEKNQAGLPVFDTGIYDTSFTSLFYENRFAGADRVGDTNQVTLAITSNLYSDETGKQISYFNIGQSIYLRDRTVVIPGLLPQDDDLSALVMEFGATYIDNWNIRSELQWDPNSNETRKITFAAQYAPEKGKVLNLAYRVRRQQTGILLNNVIDIEQTDISFRWPVNPQWSVVGKWNYATSERKSLDLFGGIEYDSCCWSFRAVVHRFLNAADSALTGEFQTGFFLQLELKGLAGIGQKTVDFLAESIPGYENEF